MTPQEALVVLLAVEHGITLHLATELLVEEISKSEPLPAGEIYDWYARGGCVLRFKVSGRRDGGIHGSSRLQTAPRRVAGVSPLRRTSTISDAIRHLTTAPERTIAGWSLELNETLFDATRAYVEHVQEQHQPTPGCRWSWDRVRGEVIEVVPGADVDLDELGLTDEERKRLEEIQAPVLAELGRQLNRREKRAAASDLRSQVLGRPR